jgi:hypothetical protein
MRFLQRAPAQRVAWVFVGMLLGACSDDSSPTQPGDPMIELAVQRQLDADAHPSEASFRRLAADIPGFAGVWYDDATKTFQVMATSSHAAARVDAVRTALASAFPGAANGRYQVRPAKHDFVQLSDWRRQARAVFADPRVTGLDLDERANMIAVVVKDGAARADVLKILKRAGVPADVVRIDVERPQEPFVTLQAYNRPKIENGFQVAYPISGGTGFCTLGADVTGPGGPVKGFLTNSHCNSTASGSLNGSTGTLFYQPTVSISYLIGASTINRPLFTGGACPAGKSCRYSDAQFVDYYSDDRWSGHQIAETSVIGTGGAAGNLTVASYRVAPSTSNVLTGFVVRKTGRTSGTTQGSVTATCQDTQFGLVTTVILLCQDKVSANSQGGDSGSPVYFNFSYPTPTSTVYHVGLLWQGNGSVFTLSPWSGIASDLPVAY